MGERISEREAARRLGKTYNSIAWQRRQGNFAFGPDGKLDWDEVQANYQTQRPAQHPEATRREQNARITSTVVKANFGKVRLTHIERSYTQRTVSRETLEGEVDRFLTALLAMPPKGAPALALAFDLTQTEATAILSLIVTTAMEELGELVAEAEHVFEAA
jgi:hypothetical protein